MTYRILGIVLLAGCSGGVSGNACDPACAGGEACVEGECQQLCARNSDCADPTPFCGGDGYCIRASDACGGCLSWEACFESECREECTTSCTDASDACAAGVCLPTGGPCGSGTCEADEVCVSGACGTVCGGDEDCGSTTEVCVDGVCLVAGDQPCGAVTCAAGSVCIDNGCVTVCNGTTDCDAGEECVSRRCQPIQIGEDPPTISAITGDGSQAGTFRQKLTVTGAFLSGAQAELHRPDRAGATPRGVLEAGSQMVVNLPDDLVAGDYTLRVVGQGGSCSTAVTLLQGEQGDQGDQGDPGTPGPAGQGLLADFELEETTGPFEDNSPLAIQAVARGSVSPGALGHSGLAVDFVNGALTVPAGNTLPDSPAIFVEAWIRPDVNSQPTRILTKEGAYALSREGGNIRFTVSTAGAGPDCMALTNNAPIDAATGAWYHVGGWYDGISVAVVIGGRLGALTPCSQGPIAASLGSPFHIGGLVDSGGAVTEPFKGEIERESGCVARRPATAASPAASP